MDTEWLQVRLRRVTAERIRAFGRRVDKSVMEGRLVVDEHPVHGLTLETLVCILLDREEAHAERNKKRRKKG